MLRVRELTVSQCVSTNTRMCPGRRVGQRPEPIVCGLCGDEADEASTTATPTRTGTSRVWRAVLSGGM